MIGNNPITVSDLTTGDYTVEVTAVDSNDMNVENNRIIKMITVCDKSAGMHADNIAQDMYNYIKCININA